MGIHVRMSIWDQRVKETAEALGIVNAADVQIIGKGIVQVVSEHLGMEQIFIPKFISFFILFLSQDEKKQTSKLYNNQIPCA